MRLETLWVKMAPSPIRMATIMTLAGCKMTMLVLLTMVKLTIVRFTRSLVARMTWVSYYMACMELVRSQKSTIQKSRLRSEQSL
jgi:hypothetical protein